MKRFLTPYLDEYVHVYRPKQDVYLGENTKSFCHGKTYDWVVNDFTVVQKGGKVHLIGITHPKPPGFVDGYTFDAETLHEAEFQFFHAAGAPGENGFLPDSFTELPKFAYPAQRPGEQNEAWAPNCVEKDGVFHLFYSPHGLRLATSEDLVSWRFHGTLFSGDPMLRDPCVLEDGGTYTMFYVEDNRVDMRTSKDLVNWSEPAVVQENPFCGGMSESPVCFKKDGVYYLLWCLCDGQNGSYDDRTFVYAAKSLADFKNASPIAMLRAHAPEVFVLNGQYYLASAQVPERGISFAKLHFK